MMGRLLRRMRGERGLALPLALLVLATTGALVVSAVEFSSSSGRTANVGKARVSAESLAEAGLANAFSVLNYWNSATMQNNAYDPTLLGCNAAGTVCTPIVSTFNEGTATWKGVLNTTTSIWSITSIGQVINPTGGPGLTKTLTASVNVTWNNTQPANASAWNYVYSTKAQSGGCEVTLNANNVVIDAPMYVAGDLCFSANNAVIDERGEGQTPAPQPVDVRVGGKAVFGANGTSIGVATDNITSAAVAGGCTTSIGTAGTACNTAAWNTTRYFADTTTTFTAITAPTADFASFYLSASPGPKHPCVTATNPANLAATVFDNDGVRDGNDGTFSLTPSGTSYQCKTYYGDATSGTQIGELSWNHLTDTLTIKGAIYIDGNVTSGDTSATYQGSGTLYVGGKFEFTSNATQLCANTGCDFTTWNPNSEMLLIIANGASGDIDAVLFNGNNGKFQGGIFCNPTSRVNFNGNNIEVMGPVICGTMEFANNVILKPLPTITELPLGAPTNPNVHAVPATPSYGG
jgi:Tfp pilus assembly protein PilX